MTEADNLVMGNAVISSTELGFCDGLLTAKLWLDFGGGVTRCFGGIEMFPRLDRMGQFVDGCVEAAGVEKWEELPGRPVRTVHDRSQGRVLAIGHIVDAFWFNLAELEGIAEGGE